jgi:hypothetical protein
MFEYSFRFFAPLIIELIKKNRFQNCMADSLVCAQVLGQTNRLRQS